MRSATTTLILSLLSLISSSAAQTTTATAPAVVASPDGVIVPFNSGLPVCASKCGPLFDVQGKCSPPATTAVDQNCFCEDPRLTVFNNGGGVSLVCGPQSCTVQADMDAVKKWYDDLCKKDQVVTTTASNGAVATQPVTKPPKTSTGNNNATWISTHYKWVIMIVIIFFAIVFGWLGACFFRRRYLRRKEREIEMRPPVAWGPHQMQGATGGYNHGCGDLAGNGGVPNGAGGHAKEYASAAVSPKGKRDSKGLHKKVRT